MRLLCIHPSALMYTRVFLRLEPLGLELIAAAARQAGHEVYLIDLQVETHADVQRVLTDWRPDAICFSGNYLANIPEIVDLSKAVRAALPGSFIFVGGHSASFIAEHLLAHGEGAIDCVLTGEGEASVVDLLEHSHDGRLTDVPGTVCADGRGPPPRFVDSLDKLRPARDLLRHRRKYFIGTLDPCASIEFARGCPWDCTFCSAWTFYGRSYRTVSAEIIADELEAIEQPGIFIVDDVAFIQSRHGFDIAEAIIKRGIKKKYYLETRGDVLLRNKEVFRLWRKIGLEYMFIGLEAIDEEGLKRFRKRTTLDKNFEALEFARSLGITVAINIIADPSWDRARFQAVRDWCMDVPEIVNISVNTPYPGTEIWQRHTELLTSRDYRLFDIQHAVLPTTLPLADFYDELVKTQAILYRKHLGWNALKHTAGLSAKLLMKGQTNFVRSLWKFKSVFDPALQLADHASAVRYEMPLMGNNQTSETVYIHAPAGRRARSLDAATEQFVDETRMGS